MPAQRKRQLRPFEPCRCPAPSSTAPSSLLRWLCLDPAGAGRWRARGIERVPAGPAAHRMANRSQHRVGRDVTTRWPHGGCRRPAGRHAVDREPCGARQRRPARLADRVRRARVPAAPGRGLDRAALDAHGAAVSGCSGAASGISTAANSPCAMTAASSMRRCSDATGDPGWTGSLILDGAAPPLAAVGWRRPLPQVSSSPWLQWMGPWMADVFFGRLFGHDPRLPALIGLRLQLQPFDRLQLGLSRTLQWGGHGRDESFESLMHGLIGWDNVGTRGITADNQPGNQLGGFDWRLELGDERRAGLLRPDGRRGRKRLPAQRLHRAGRVSRPVGWCTKPRCAASSSTTT